MPHVIYRVDTVSFVKGELLDGVTLKEFDGILNEFDAKITPNI